jgi:hypothetical protein
MTATMKMSPSGGHLVVTQIGDFEINDDIYIFCVEYDGVITDCFVIWYNCKLQCMLLLVSWKIIISAAKNT